MIYFSSFPHQNIVYASCVPVRAKCFAHLSLLDLNIQIIFDEK